MSDCNHLFRDINSYHSQCARCGTVVASPCDRPECNKLRNKVSELEARELGLIHTMRGLTQEIKQLREDIAQLLGYDSYAEQVEREKLNVDA